MRSKLLLLFLLPANLLLSQQDKELFRRTGFEKERFISVNVLSLAEPQLAFGPSLGYRFTDRSEFFLEAAYITRSPFYKWEDIDRLQGLRTIVQYRYHFLQQWRPLINTGGRRRLLRSMHQPFIGLEFRAKPFSFSTKRDFVNPATADTLDNYSFRANAFVYGGALVFGSTFDLSSDGRWKFECSFGIGAKERLVKYKTVPEGYQRPQYEKRIAFQLPSLDEEIGTAYFPFAIRLRYVLD